MDIRTGSSWQATRRGRAGIRHAFSQGMDLDQKKHDVDVLERVLGGGVREAGAGEPGGEDEDQVVEVPGSALSSTSRRHVPSRAAPHGPAGGRRTSTTRTVVANIGTPARPATIVRHSPPAMSSRNGSSIAADEVSQFRYSSRSPAPGPTGSPARVQPTRKAVQTTRNVRE